MLAYAGVEYTPLAAAEAFDAIVGIDFDVQPGGAVVHRHRLARADPPQSPGARQPLRLGAILFARFTPDQPFGLAGVAFGGWFFRASGLILDGSRFCRRRRCGG